ncbi:hypothetical protein [Halopolyspora algeriensis]|nr:hypothetical protein [Halopolyspora algeriensis]
MRIGEPARKHGIRHGMRRIVMDEDLTMLIEPSRAGALLEIGVLDLDGDDPVAIHAMPLRGKFHRFL